MSLKHKKEKGYIRTQNSRSRQRKITEDIVSQIKSWGLVLEVKSNKISFLFATLSYS